MPRTAMGVALAMAMPETQRLHRQLDPPNQPCASDELLPTATCSHMPPHPATRLPPAQAYRWSGLPPAGRRPTPCLRAALQVDVNRCNAARKRRKFVSVSPVMSKNSAWRTRFTKPRGGSPSAPQSCAARMARSVLSIPLLRLVCLRASGARLGCAGWPQTGKAKRGAPEERRDEV